MNAAEFDKIMNTVQATYGYKINDETRRVTWGRVQHVPSRHVGVIVDRLCDYETLPRAFNLGKAILDVFKALDPQGAGLSGEDSGRWINACSECDPGRWKGSIVYFTQTTTGRIDKHLMPCARCQPNSARKGTRASLSAQGFLVPPSPGEVSRWYKHMAKANNPELFTKEEGMFGELFRDMGRMAQAVRPGRADE